MPYGGSRIITSQMADIMKELLIIFVLSQPEKAGLFSFHPLRPHLMAPEKSATRSLSAEQLILRSSGCTLKSGSHFEFHLSQRLVQVHRRWLSPGRCWDTRQLCFSPHASGAELLQWTKNHRLCEGTCSHWNVSHLTHPIKVALATHVGLLLIIIGRGEW